MSAVGGLGALDAISPRRRRTDRIARAAVLALTVVAVVPLVLVVYYLVEKGLGALSVEFFTTDPTGNFLGNPGGIRSALLGTLEMVLVASAMAIPTGIGVAVWLVEYGRGSRLASVVRFFVDVLTGVPSIVFGLFIYITLVLSGALGGSFAAWKGAAALALLMLPVVIRSAEVVLALVPNGLRESALALGAPRWRMIWKVVLPTALPGLLTGSLLAVARAMGETAPLIFTAQATLVTSYDLNARMNSLPIQIFGDVQNANAEVVQRAWGSALTLVALILLITLVARFAAARRSRLVA